MNCGRRPPGDARGRSPEAARARSSRAFSLSRRPLSRALVCVPTLCFDPVPVGSSPGPPPCSLGSVSSWLRGPGGVFLLGLGDDTPSVRKPSLAIREGALGYRTPQLPPLLWKRVRLDAPVFVRSGPSRAGFEGPSGDAAVPYRGPRLPPPSRGRVPPGRGRRPSRGRALRLRERAHARVAACRRGWGGRGGLSRPPAFPLPRLERLSARSRHTGSQPTGVLRGHGRGPACPRGALRPGRESPSGSDWADERMGGWRGSRGGSPVVAEGRACDLSALARGLGRAAGGGFVVVRLGGSERRSRASRGRPCVSVAVGSPCLFTRRPVSRSGALPRCPPSAVRAREKERGL